MLGNFSCLFDVCWFFYNILFQNILSGTPSECQTLWIQVKANVKSGLIWVQLFAKVISRRQWRVKSKLIEFGKQNKILMCSSECNATVWLEKVTNVWQINPVLLNVEAGTSTGLARPMAIYGQNPGLRLYMVKKKTVLWLYIWLKTQA